MFAFSSLGVVAEGLAKSRPGTALSVVADARRESWHRVRVNEQGKVSALERVPSDQLSGPLITPEGFRQWASPPPNLEAVHYDLRQWLGLLGEVQLFRPTEQPDAFLHEEPAYQTWTPRVHRAPS
jgi:tRNA threonylcarbamoyladenosine biosynthesis protein TsaB